MTGASPVSARLRHGGGPGDGLLHPVVVGALGVLLLNDHVLKASWPGFVTGKLSDVAGLILAPIALQAAWEVARAVRGTWRRPSVRVLAVAIVVVGVAFAASQVWPPATELYRWGLGALQWPFRAVASIAGGRAMPDVVPVITTADAGDLLTLPALAVTWLVGRRRAMSAS